MAMFVSVMRSSRLSEEMPSPAKCMVLYVAPATPISPMTARMRSLAVRYGGIWPWKLNFMVGGTFSHVLPVPSVKAASVLPTPEANCPKAPAVQVWLSVPNMISPGRQCPSSGSAL